MWLEMHLEGEARTHKAPEGEGLREP